jgi:hypothetical protein
MRRHPHRILHQLLAASLIILAAMHPAAVTTCAELGAGILLAIVEGVADAASHNPGPAALVAGAFYIAHQARTHKPPARARAHH